MALSDDTQNTGKFTPDEVNLDKLIYDNRERLKELKALNDTTAILKKGRNVEETLNEICHILPAAWQYPEDTAARIRFDDMEFTTPNFTETEWKQVQKFDTIDNAEGEIEIVYLKEFPVADEGPFLSEERSLILNISSLIEGWLNSIKGKEGRYITRERLKELAAINQTTRILRTGAPIEESLHEIWLMLRSAYQYPEFAVCRIKYGNIEHKSPNFAATKWCQQQVFETIDNQEGVIEIYYLKAFPQSFEGP